jgi:hypothetical protein
VRQVHKEYAKPFLLERTKLTRILDKIHERLALHAHTTSRDRFEVFMSGDRREEMVSVDAVLQLDNSRRRKIRRLLIVCSAASDEVQVDFCVSKTKVQGEAINSGKVVAISVRSDDNGWASSTLSEIEEQVERTWSGQSLYVATLALIAAGMILFLASQFLGWQTRADLVDGLQPNDVTRVEKMLDQGNTLSEEQLREVETMRLRNVVSYERPAPPPTSTSRKLVVFGIPLFGLLCVAIMLMTQYPPAVFLWGDEVDRHNSRLQWRKALWGLVVSVLVAGIASKLLYEGAASWIPK